jgi:hypothetical protein
LLPGLVSPSVRRRTSTSVLYSPTSVLVEENPPDPIAAHADRMVGNNISILCESDQPGRSRSPLPVRKQSTKRALVAPARDQLSDFK